MEIETIVAANSLSIFSRLAKIRVLKPIGNAEHTVTTVPVIPFKPKRAERAIPIPKPTPILMKMAIAAFPILQRRGLKYSPRAIIIKGTVGCPSKFKKFKARGGIGSRDNFQDRAITKAHNGGKRKNFFHSTFPVFPLSPYFIAL